jgi:hypothetical protein
VVDTWAESERLQKPQADMKNIIKITKVVKVTGTGTGKAYSSTYLYLQARLLL